MVYIMLRQLERAEQKWGGSNKLIDQWLNHRRKLLIEYCQIAGLPPYHHSERTLPSLQQVKQFCDSLVDYVSEGHFEVYDQIVSVCESHGKPSQELAQNLLPKINKTTDVALDFTDKYTEIKKDEALLKLDKDLGLLLQAIELRFELEDNLLEVLHVQFSETEEST